MSPTFPKLVLVFLVASLLTACVGGAVEEPTPTAVPAPTTIPRPIYRVERGDVVSQTIFSGQVVPSGALAVAFETSGKVKEILVAPGDAVTQGQLLATLDVSVEEKQLAGLKDSLVVLEADAQRALRKAELALLVAQKTLELYRSLGKSDLEIEIAELQAELAQIEFDEITQANSFDSQRQEVARLEEIVTHAALLSPADSHVLEVLTVPDRLMDFNTPVLNLGDPNALEVKARVSGEVLALLKEGMVARISRDEAGVEALSGIIRLLPAPYGQGTEGDLRITLQGQPAQTGYQINNQVTVEILIESRKDVLWLPPQAIFEVGGRTFVFVFEGDEARRVDIQVGLPTEQRVEITAGLQEGQEVTEP